MIAVVAAWRRRHDERVATVALAAALFVALAGPGPVGGTTVDAGASVAPSPALGGPALVTQALGGGLELVLADEVGHRFDGGRVREVAVGTDGSVWVAVGRRVVQLGRPGAVDSRTRSWRSFPRHISVDPDGTLWAVEDGGAVIVLGDDGWAEVTDAARRPDASVALTVDLPLEQMQGYGIDGQVRVLAVTPGSDEDVWLVADTGRGRHVRPMDPALVHHGAAGLQVIDSTAGMPGDDGRAWTTSTPDAMATIVVDHEGRVWFSIYRLGLYVFDGSGFERVVAPGLGLGALDLDVGPDGSVWIAGMTGGLYRWEADASLT